MKRRWLLLGLCCAIACGCAKPCPPAAPPPPVCHQYQAPGFDWSSIRRILLVPLANESAYPQGTFEIQEALAARMQCYGRFEVVLAIPDTHIACRDAVRISGRFDEVELLELADDHNVDAVLFGTITQYQPYAPPRVGLSLRLIHPGTASLVASVDGLWDSRDRSVAEQARCYTALSLNDEQSLRNCDLVLESPALFRRFACHYAVEALVNPVPYPAPASAPIQPASASQPGSPAPTNPTAPAIDVPFPPPVPPVPAESPLVLPTLTADPAETPLLDDPQSPDEFPAASEPHAPGAPAP